MSSPLRVRSGVAAALVLLSVACASSDTVPFPADVVTRGTLAGANVDQAALQDHVLRIVNGRLLETPVPMPFIGDSDELVPFTQKNSATYIADAFRTAGLSPILETTNEHGVELSNIRVDIKGRDDAVVLVTGHHDAWYQAGADDNASAIAILVEGARVLKDQTFKHPIRFVALDGEELGLVGVQRYREAHKGERLRVVLNMDCIGFASSAAGSQDTPPGLALRDKGDFLAVLANDPARDELIKVVRASTSLPDKLEVLGLIAPGDSHTPATEAFLASDHVEFWRAGVPALFFTDTAYLRNSTYHTEQDTPDTLDYGFLTHAARVVVMAAVGFAED